MSSQRNGSPISQSFVKSVRGPIGPISAMGPDCYREVVQPQNNNNVAALLVRRDETHSGWSVSQLPGRLATVTCNGQTVTGTPNWSNFTFGGMRYGLLDISSVYDADYDTHVEYTYDPGTGDETYWDDFAANQGLSLSTRGHEGTGEHNAEQSLTTPSGTPANQIVPGVVQEEARVSVQQDASGNLVLHKQPAHN